MDKDKQIAAQSVMKSLLESDSFPSPIEGPVAQKAWIDEMFPYCLKKIEDYSRTPTSAVATPPFPVNPNPRHLSDEQVASGIAKERDERQVNNWPVPTHVTLKNGQTVMYATPAQHGRAYAIAMGRGWNNKSLKDFLFKNYGISDNRKGIYACFYEEIVRSLEMGPQ